LNSIFDKEQQVVIDSVASKRKRELEEKQTECEKKYREALRVVQELGPFFGHSPDTSDEAGKERVYITLAESEEEAGPDRHAKGETSRSSASHVRTDEFHMDMSCCICWDALRDAYLHSCKHVTMCMTCAEITKEPRRVKRKGEYKMVERYKCPICRKFSTKATKTFFS
jgi:hypothetical protein